jgi:hypothetical protein
MGFPAFVLPLAAAVLMGQPGALTGHALIGIIRPPERSAGRNIDPERRAVPMRSIATT